VVGRLRAGRRRALAVLLLLPFALTALTGIRHLYPYGNTRHVALLYPFAAAGVGLAAARLPGWWKLLLVPAGAAVGLVWLVSEPGGGPRNHPPLPGPPPPA